MSAATVPPVPETDRTDVELRDWWSAYNKGWQDCAQAFLDAFGVTGATVDDVRVAVTLARHEPDIRAALSRYGLIPTAV